MNIKQKLKHLNKKFREKGKTNTNYFNKEIDNNGKWGYYLNVDIENVIDYLNENDLKTVVDLGAGEGHIVEIFNEMGFEAKGYEIEDELIENYNKEFGKGNITKKDIMYLTTDDIKDFEVIYFYQPFKNIQLMEQFLAKLVNIMTPNQIILFEKDGANPKLFQTSNTNHNRRGKSLEIFKKQ